ncbi:Protein phosphatase 1 regulatory subunit 15 [Carabus blaptoides fortunei]
MNFNFNQRRFHIGPPIMRHYSTIGLVAAKPEQIDFTLKPDYIFKNVQNNFFNNIGPNVFQNKSFSNPNFVNKQNPNILTPNVAKHFDKSRIDHPIYENVINSCVIQPPKHENHGRIPEENHLVYQPIPDKVSSQHNSHMSVHKHETETQEKKNVLPEPLTVSPKSSKKTIRSRKNRKSKRSKQEFIPIEPSADQKSKMTQKKADKTWCSSPKKLKKDHDTPRSRNRKGKKDKHWHKMTFDMEIMELDDSSFNGTPESPNCPVLETPPKSTICVQLKSSPIEISPKCGLNLCESSLSVSPCTEFLRNLSTSNTSTSDYSCSPASPAIRRLRMPSECDSEDSFIVFCDDISSCMSEDEVSFKMDSELCDVHPMVQWSFAYQKARIGPWEQYARDRARFETRIKKTESILSAVLQRDHRDKIFSERFNNPD